MKGRRLACGLVLALIAGIAAAADAPAPGAPAPVLSSQRDYSINGERNAPVECRESDIAPFRGKTVAQVFGDAWPQQPEPTSPADHQAPTLVAPGHITPPRGLESQRAVVVVASLIGTDGRPVRAEALCMSAPGFDTVAKRAAKTARFEPARVNGAAVTSVVVVPYVFKPSARSVRNGTNE